ncbi:hypothetical protein [Prosthecodimorpha staleyi]|uniref:Transmembrane protein n=1 Tax=Prosthecodimorpha staleyi TaxID=2840188 RepID=A0A947D833_9HYPH|nr:hypothetical protein [Prosthecodimorpha staleyi]MBT9289932.1 hypothetical protein [Prosthecodimorpha staleyi]
MQGTLNTIPQGAADSRTSGTSWGAIIAGAVAAAAISVVLTLIGTGLGLTMVSPWSGEGVGLTTLAVSTVIWLIIVQWASAGVGGYLTGRLRTRWAALHTDEVFFRDTAHGFMAWALATLLVVGMLGSGLAGVLSGGARVAAGLASGAVAGASAGAAANVGPGTASVATSYFVDTLFRPSDPARLSGPEADGAGAAAAQATRILVTGATGDIRPEDRTYLAQLVAARTGLNEADAKTRVDAVLARVEEAKVRARQAADSARKASAALAFTTALALMIGAFIASVAAALGARLRDDDDATLATVGGHRPALA